MLKFVKHNISKDFSAGYSTNQYEYNAEMLADKMPIVLITYYDEVVKFLREQGIVIKNNISLTELNDKILLNSNKQGINKVLAYLLSEKNITKNDLIEFAKNLQSFIKLMLKDKQIHQIYEKRLMVNLVEEQKKQKNSYNLVAKSSLVSYISLIVILGVIGIAIFKYPQNTKDFLKNIIV